MPVSVQYSSINTPNDSFKPTSTESTPRSFAFVLCCVLITIFAGALHSTQTGLNVALMSYLNDQALRSSFVSFSVGSLSLLPFFLYDCRDTTIPRFSYLFNRLNSHKIEYICFLNGILASFYMTCAIFVSPKIGFALYFICVVTGQMILSNLLDWYQHTLKSHIIRIIGLIILASGVIICQIDNITSSESLWYYTILYCLLGILAGFAAVTRSFMNRRFQYHLKSPYLSAGINFIGAMLCCLIAVIIQWLLIKDRLFSENDKSDYYGFKWSNCYIWFGGVLGVIYLCIVSIIMPGKIGYVGSYVCAICGNLAMSTVYDTYGVFGNVRELTEMRIIGIVLVFIAVLGVNTPKLLGFEMTGVIDKAEQELLLPMVGGKDGENDNLGVNDGLGIIEDEFDQLIQL